MKKIVVGLAVLGLMVACASAGIGVAWTAQYGGYNHSASSTTNSTGALLDTYSVTWQLIYAGTNNLADAVSLSTGGPNGNYVSGDDVVWGTRQISIGGGSGNDAPNNTTWDNWMINQTGNVLYEDLAWSTSGKIFQRVFEGTPAVLSWYFQTDLVDLNTGYTGSPALPQTFYLDTPAAGFKPNQQIGAVPEPATMGLLGLGALVMAIRRRRS